MPTNADDRWLIVGLGNPGTAYAQTRHNLGFQVVDRLAARHHGAFARSRMLAQVADCRINDQRVLLAKPQTWMNNSGDAVQPLLHWHKIPLERLVVIYDELDLPLGRIRIREKGSAGGHNGVASIIQRLGANGFPRIRIGISRPIGAEQINYVLTPFRREEVETIEVARERAADAVEVILRDGVTAAMNQYNGV